MTLLSVVVPVYRVQAYLQECLDSVLGQDFTDIEVIAVDDCTPDHSGELLDEIAAKDDRVRVLHLEQNIGLGPARNAGLAEATGRYVMFLDSDDSLVSGSLATIAERLEATRYPEMLILDHARTFWWGKVQRNLQHELLADLTTAPFTAEEHPEIFDLLHVAWNKVCRRDFLEREELVFPPGYYEDTPWTYKALFTAKSIATLPMVVVHYRQRRHGSILGTKSGRHLEGFAQWERVFDFLDTRPDLSHWRSTVYTQMVHQYLTILGHPERLPADARAEFFHRTSEHMRRFAAKTKQPLSGREQLRYELLRRDAYGLFRALQSAEQAARRGKGAGRRAIVQYRRGAGYAKHLARQMEYRRALRGPLDLNLVVFAAYWNRGYACNPKAIYEQMGRLAPNLRGVWVVRESQAATMPDGVDYVISGTRGYWRLMARAKYFVNNVNFPDSVVKRPGQIHVQTQHGTPLKHMGLDLRAHPAASATLDFADLLHRSDRWDVNISSNRFSTIVWEQAFPCDFRSLESGYPRNDVLVNAAAHDVARARAQLGIPPEKTAVLYAPTHRDHDKGFVLRADLARLVKQLGPDFVLMVRAHYFYRLGDELTRLVEQGLLLNVSVEENVETLMLASDVLVTDYSSIMFDYANLDRPIVVFAPDWDTYRDVRGVYFDLLAAPPGAVAQDQDHLADLLKGPGHDNQATTQARQAFRERFCEYDDGHAAERVVRNVFFGEPVLPVIPVRDRRAPVRPPEILEDLRAASAVAPIRPRSQVTARSPSSVGEPVKAAVDNGEPGDPLEPGPGLRVSEAQPSEAGDEVDGPQVNWEPSGGDGRKRISRPAQQD